MSIEAARLSVVVTADVDNAERGLGRVDNSIGRTSGFIRDVGATAFGFLSAQAAIAGAGVAREMFSLGTSTQTAMNIFQAVTRASGDEMGRVGKLARDLGNDLSLPATSSKDAYQAMVELAKAGLSVENTMGAAKGTLQLATAANVDAATAAEINANALNAFGLSGDKAVHIADLLAASANASSGEITDMAFALRMSSAVFASAGVPIEDLTAAIGVMANKGIIGSDAGTSLKQMMLQLEAPTKKAAGVMKELGIKVYDSHGKMRPFRDIIGNVSEATKDLTQEQRDMALKVIFGADAIRAATILTSGGTKAFDAMRVAVDRQGAAQELSAARMKGVGGAMEGLKSQIETTLIDAFNRAAPSMEKALRWASENFPAGLAAIQRAWVQYGQPAMEAIIEVTGRIVAWVQENWPEIRKQIVEVMDTIESVVSSVLSIIETLWNNFGNNILEFVKRVWPDIKQTISGFLEIIRGVFELFAALLKGDWSGVWDALKEIVHGFFNAVHGLVKVQFELVRAAIGIALEVIGSMFKRAWEEITTGVSAAFDAIVGVFAGVGRRVSAVAVGMFDGIKDAFKAAINFIIDGWNRLEFKIPGFKVMGVGYDGFTLGVPDIQRLHSGGVFNSGTGPMGEGLALLQNGERVIPRGGANGGVMNVTINMPPGSDGQDVVDAITRWERSNGSAWRAA